jgi:hypothetical protein
MWGLGATREEAGAGRQSAAAAPRRAQSASKSSRRDLGRYRGEDTARVRFIDGWVMPSLLRGKLPTVHDDRMLPDTEMAIVFVSTHIPAAEEAIVRKAVELFGDRVRGLLNVHGGYECKEPEPCKFTLSFRTFQGAVRFSAELHLQLLDAGWPAALLRFPCCGDEYDDEGGLIYRGLRARIGIAFSKPTSRKPLSSGRAGARGNERGIQCSRHLCSLPPRVPIASIFFFVAGLNLYSFALARPLPPFLFCN